MSNIREFPTQNDAIADKAGDWIARMGGGLSVDEERELGEWLARKPENYRLFMEMAQLWDQMDVLARLSDICPKPTEIDHRRRARQSWSIAAAVVLGIVSVLWFAAGEAPRNEAPIGIVTAQATMYETAVGQQLTQNLPDGTVIVLNTNTLVSVDYSEANRFLTLLRGEMHVIVAHDPSRPLSVVVGDKVVQAVGTEFNLEITSEQGIELVVTDGLVMVGVLDGPIDESPEDVPLILTPSSTLVAAGQTALFDAQGAEVDSIVAEAIESENVSIKLSWREGNLIFRGESLEEAVLEVGRYTAVEFIFLDEESKKVRVAGLFKAGDVDGLLAALRLHFNISYEWQGDDKIILSAD